MLTVTSELGVSLQAGISPSSFDLDMGLQSFVQPISPPDLNLRDCVAISLKADGLA